LDKDLIDIDRPATLFMPQPCASTMLPQGMIDQAPSRSGVLFMASAILKILSSESWIASVISSSPVP
jgi:hypothetical protein